MCGICGCSGNNDKSGDSLDNQQSFHHFNGTTVTHFPLQKVQLDNQKHLELHLLGENDHQAEHNREDFSKQNILCLNLVSSPGSGKTTLLETTLKALFGTQAMYVIEGDQQTDQDAKRIAKTGVQAIQVNTGAGCHLDAKMVRQGLKQIEMEKDSILFVENVGNLVCPALFDLGEAAKVAVISVTEGEDKPLKYPHMFRASELMIINKMDIEQYVPFAVDKCVEFARQVNPTIQIIKLSALTAEGMDEWYQWLDRKHHSLLAI